MTHDAVGRIAFEKSKYRKLWQATSERPANDAPLGDGTGGHEMPQLDAATLRAASEAFSKSTSYTFDGVHPRHFALLSDDALECLAMLLTACKNIGEWPEELVPSL